MKDPKQRDFDHDRPEQPEQPLGYKVIESGPAPSADQTATPEPEPANRYKVIEPEPKSLEAEAAELYSFRAQAEEEAKQTAAAAAPPLPPDVPVWVERLRKFAESPKRVLAAAGAGLAVLAAIVLAFAFLLPGTPEGRYDLGWSTNDAAGLNGHLHVAWEKKLTYRLKIEPNDPAQIPGFSLAVGHPPRPESITVDLENSEGFNLCSTEIVLRYDPRSAAADAAADQVTDAGGTDGDGNATGAPAPAVDFGQLDAQEAAREKGKDIFQNQLGPDGQIVAITVQGTMPCSKKVYENAESWSFTPNFPPLVEQTAMVARFKEAQEAARRAEEARRWKAHRPAVPLLPFSIEGDDAIVAFDPAHGVIETDGNKTFYFHPSASGTDPAWKDYPVSIHYRCDRASNCVIMHEGAGMLRVRLKR